MSGPTRYPKPGTLVWAWWEAMPGYVSTHGSVAVLATSRHVQRITESQAAALLCRPVERTAFWRSVTKAQWDAGECAAEVDGPGSWAEDGWGDAWVEVAYPTIEAPEEAS